MGWSSGWESRSELKEYLLSPSRLGAEYRVIAKADKRNVLWYIVEKATGERILACDLIRRFGAGDWGYKALDESMGPCEVSCPIAYLDLVPDPGSYATEWREKVRAYHAKQARKFTVGQNVTLQNCKVPSVTITSLRPLLGEYEGRTYRIPKGLIA